MDAKKKILYVDDEEVNLLIFEKIFEKNYKVVTANSGEKGLKLLEDQPDTTVVISDMKMPLMSGLEFIQEAKSKFSDIKYFILTAFHTNEEIREAMEKNLINNCFTKPLDFNQIDHAIQDALE